MKRILQISCALLLVCSLLLSACSGQKERANGKPQKAKAPDTVEANKEKQTSSEPAIEKGTPEWDMQQVKKAVDENNQELFMSYQNKDNVMFYKEQKRWIDEAAYKKKQGYKLSLDFYNFKKENETTGTVSFAVMMSHPNLGETTNSVTYQIIKVNDKWLLNDMPFATMATESKNLTVYYMKGQEEAAQQTLKDASDIVAFYSKKFNWKPQPMTIKIYPSAPDVSATVPWISLGGWNEIGESLKITTDFSQNIFRYLAHELTHKMVGDMANDNATIYIQEGIATYFEGTVVRDPSGHVVYDPKQATTKVEKMLKDTNAVKSIEELGTIDYSDPEGSMYRDGFLLSNYLITTKGLPTFFTMIHSLSNFEYIDDRAEHKMDTCQVHTVEAIEKTYGSADKVSDDCRKYYLSVK